MKSPLISGFLVLLVVLAVTFLVPIAAMASGGGGDGEGGTPLSGALELTGFVFIDPSSVGGMDIAGGTVDINNIPEYVPLTPREQFQIQQMINRSEANFWTAMGYLAGAGEVGSKIGALGGKVAGWVLAFTPAGIPVKIAIAATRGVADGYASSVEKGDGKEASQATFSGIVSGTVEGVTSSFNPVVGIVAGEVAGNLANSEAPNRAPGPNIGDAAMRDARVTHDPYTGRAFTAPVYR